MPGVSKYALRFQNRILSFDEDLELVDIICRARKGNDFLLDNGAIFKYFDPTKHPSLSNRKNTETSKAIVINHLRSTVHSAYIKDIFEELTDYLRQVIYETAILSKDQARARRLLGEHKVSFSASDILQYNSLDELIRSISDCIIQALESERSTKDLICKICTKIDLPVDRGVINSALPYLELRHKLVHADGRADEQFKRDYSVFEYNSDNYIILNHRTIMNAKLSISALVLAIDAAAITKGLLRPNTP